MNTHFRRGGTFGSCRGPNSCERVCEKEPPLVNVSFYVRVLLYAALYTNVQKLLASSTNTSSCMPELWLPITSGNFLAPSVWPGHRDIVLPLSSSRSAVDDPTELLLLVRVLLSNRLQCTQLIILQYRGHSTVRGIYSERFAHRITDGMFAD